MLDAFGFVDIFLEDALHRKQFISVNYELDRSCFAVAHFDVSVLVDDLLTLRFLVLAVRAFACGAFLPLLLFPSCALLLVRCR